LFYNLSKCFPAVFLIYFIPAAAVVLRASHALMAQCCIIVLMISLFALLTLNFVPRYVCRPFLVAVLIQLVGPSAHAWPRNRSQYVTSLTQRPF
jgi:hypothetical protein